MFGFGLDLNYGNNLLTYWNHGTFEHFGLWQGLQSLLLVDIWDMVQVEWLGVSHQIRGGMGLPWTWVESEKDCWQRPGNDTKSQELRSDFPQHSDAPASQKSDKITPNFLRLGPLCRHHDLWAIKNGCRISVNKWVKEQIHLKADN